MKTVLIKAVPASLAALAVGAFMFAPAVSAAGLTSDQVSAILSLVASFGADSATIANVQASLTGGTPSASANVSGSVSTGSAMPSTGSSVCAAFTHALSQGSTDSSTAGEVTRLQQFLISSGILANGSATGYFGPLTASAVAKLQVQNGLSAVGVVGPATRALLANRCMGVTPNSTTGTPTTTTTTTGTTVSTNSNANSSTAAALANIDGQLSGLGNDLGNVDSDTSQNDNDQ